MSQRANSPHEHTPSRDSNNWNFGRFSGVVAASFEDALGRLDEWVHARDKKDKKYERLTENLEHALKKEEEAAEKRHNHFQPEGGYEDGRYTIHLNEKHIQTDKNGVKYIEYDASYVPDGLKEIDIVMDHPLSGVEVRFKNAEGLEAVHFKSDKNVLEGNLQVLGLPDSVSVVFADPSKLEESKIEAIEAAQAIKGVGCSNVEVHTSVTPLSSMSEVSDIQILR